MEQGSSLFTVVVSTYRRPDTLAMVLRALAAQSMERELFEIIVCDSGSQDGTAQTVRGWRADGLRVTYADLPENSAATKRNEGIRRAIGRYVLLLDDDVVPTPGLLKAHLAAHQSGTPRKVVCGQVRFPPDWIRSSNLARFKDARQLGPGRPGVDAQNIPPKLIVTMNMSYEALPVTRECGFFSKEFKHYGGEDIEFGARLARAGYRITYSEQALAYHYEGSCTLRHQVRREYFSARYGLPVLRRLAPELLPTLGVTRLSGSTPNSPSGTAARAALHRIVFSRLAGRTVLRYLSATDRIRPLYCPLLFRYVQAWSAAAAFYGTREPEASGWF